MYIYLNFLVLFTRTLYSPSVLGLDGFQQAQQRTRLQINDVDKFKARMEDFVKDESPNSLIFTEDLKNMVHLIESKDELEKLRLMIRKFCTQSREVRFGNFVFGPVVMRMFHNLKDPETAMSFFNDESISGFFDQLATFQILLDLLFETNRFQDIIDTYKTIAEKQVAGGRYPKHVIVLTFGACYRLNTPESLAFATKLWRDCNDVGHQPMRRAVSFFAALACSQNQGQVALEVLSNVRQQNYIHIKVIKSLALAQIGRFEDIIPMLRSTVEKDNPMVDKQTMPKDFLDQLKKLFEKCTNKETLADFNRVVGFLEKNGHITDTTIDQMLTAEIRITAQTADRLAGPPGPFNKRLVDQRLRRRELDEPSTGRIRRPGLHELN